MLDDVLVVNDLVVDVNRRLERRQSKVERLDRHVDARTETTRTGQKDFHALMIVRQQVIGQTRERPYEPRLFWLVLQLLVAHLDRKHPTMRRVARLKVDERLVERL